MGTHRGSRLIHSSRRTRAGLAAAAIAALVAGMAIRPGTALGQGDSLLRAVDVTMSGDGTMTAVRATSITTRSNRSSSSSSDEFSPSETADDLPARVTTSYRTADSSGSDLSELNGYSGKVVIDVSIENLTLVAQQVSYDMDGNSYSTSALVGAPLTVVASASLEGTGAGDVIVEGDGDTTNGLVSMDSDGRTQVQWADLLAPPMMPASADLRLVVDAKNFSSPDFSISVQPGLATDSSSNSLLDASSQMRAQMDLEERTIELAAQVNQVLAQTSSTIQDVRSSLDTSAETIGAQTLSNMQSNAQNLSGAMTSVGSQLDGLKGELQSASAQSSSQTLAQLTSSVEAMSAMLGDTSGAAPDGRSTSVYATVQNIAAQLQAYADAGDDQRESVRAALEAAIGPSEPNEENCPAAATPAAPQPTSGASGPTGDETPQGTPSSKAPSSGAAVGQEAGDGQSSRPSEASATGSASSEALPATCALYQGQQSLNAAISDFTTAARSAVDGLKGSAQDTAQQASSLATAAGGALAQANTVVGDVQAVKNALPDDSARVDPATPQVAALGANIDALNTRITALGTAIDAAKAKADAGKASNDSASARLGDVTKQVCQMSAADRAKLMPLLSTKDCNGDAQTGDAQTGDAQTTSVEALLADEGATWGDLSRTLDRNDTTGGAGKALSDATATYQQLRSDYDALTAGGQAGGAASASPTSPSPSTGSASPSPSSTATGNAGGQAGDGELDAAMARLTDSAGEMQRQSSSLDDMAAELSSTAEKLNHSVNAFDGQPSALEQAISAAELAQKNGDGALDEQIRRIGSAKDGSGQSADQDVFDRSALDQQAQQMTDQAKSTIDAQNQQLANGYTQAQQSMDSATQQAQQSVADSVDQSAADLAGANALLGDDMAKLLADIGDPEAAGSGLLGSLGKNAALAQAADTQLAVASGTMTGYANVRSADLGGLLLRQAQMSAALERLDALPLFQMRKPSGGTTGSVYTFSIESSR
ncbi:hypothetical protein HMPREF0682_2430 [Propionibacterium acidifaciens F0233]|uniref:Uncharacterized protein n=1 Tax=Propionibacterium acidifaciens F0233 TaxID=553198 RepID=U2PHR9_9ACTN|nr:hypothetical protein [Propionibacterium acidifaciens]AYW78442.1 hypothetical protein EGX94_10540 [Propionibacterium acidifaciens]ERK50080.1 hypothetical protein HMPREF0682_2430 [Propionibacterium acidifaciens F0233]